LPHYLREASYSAAMKSPIPALRSIALIEGISFLLLIFVAMPLKYFAGMPLAVKLVGWAHGVLFMLLCLALLRVMLVAKWPLTRGTLVFIAALVPFGPFLIDRRFTEYEVEFRSRTSAASSDRPQ
jgi:integral membrane protein